MLHALYYNSYSQLWGNFGDIIKDMKDGIRIRYEKQIQQLQDENRVLQDEKQYLQKQLQAKRYKAVDAIVDSVYNLKKKIQPTHETPLENANDPNNTTIVEDAPAKPETKVDSGRVDIINLNFFSWDGEKMFLGGAERYVFDLAKLLKSEGYRPRILQGADFDFTKKYNEIDVIGIKMQERSVEAVSATFGPYVEDAELVISSPLEIACSLDIDRPIIAINHGVIYDTETTSFESLDKATYWTCRLALENADSCVCVDTNFINWMRTQEYRLSKKLHYIPNYYDPKLFKPAKKTDDKIHILCPRRLHKARGADLVAEAFEEIFARYGDKVDLTFVGQYNDDDVKTIVETLVKKYPKNVKHSELSPEEMPRVYAEADIVVIPTKYSEGTSLSCIEAMASGAAVIATTVGGLPNLIINDYNGILIEPSRDEVERAIVDLIEDPKRRELLAKRGEEVAKVAFQKRFWEERWKSELAKYLAKI